MVAIIFQHNRAIVRFIEAICFGNMRLALEMFTTFLISGASDVNKMLHICRRDGAYYVAYHEFVKSIMLGDRRYYKEEHSPIMNVFDCGSQRNSSHLTALTVLRALLQRRRENTPEGQGYVPIMDLVGMCEETFDNREDVIRTLNRLVSKQLVELDTRSIENIAGAGHARVTSAGWYYVRYLVRSFPYLDLVLQDTPLNDEELEQKLRRAVWEVDNLSGPEAEKIERLEARFARVEAFLDYLEAEERQERKEFGFERVGGPLADSIVPGIRPAYERQREYMRRRLRENKERSAEEELFGEGQQGEEEVEGIGAEVDEA